MAQALAHPGVSIEHAVVMQVRCGVEAAEHGLSSLVHPAGVTVVSSMEADLVQALESSGERPLTHLMSKRCTRTGAPSKHYTDTRAVILSCQTQWIYLKVQMPALWISKALKETGGRLSATHSSALRMDLWVTTRCCVPSASRISAGA